MALSGNAIRKGLPAINTFSYFTRTTVNITWEVLYRPLPLLPTPHRCIIISVPSLQPALTLDVLYAIFCWIKVGCPGSMYHKNVVYWPGVREVITFTLTPMTFPICHVQQKRPENTQAVAFGMTKGCGHSPFSWRQLHSVWISLERIFSLGALREVGWILWWRNKWSYDENVSNHVKRKEQQHGTK